MQWILQCQLKGVSDSVAFIDVKMSFEHSFEHVISSEIIGDDIFHGGVGSMYSTVLWFQWKKFRHTTPTRPMDRRNDPVEAVRAMIDQLTYLQLMVVLGMLSDELSWRYRVYR